MINDPWDFFSKNNIKELKIKLHPDKHGGTEESNKKFAQLIADYELSQTPQPIILGQKCLRQIGMGDLRKVWRTYDGVVKESIVKHKGIQKLFQKEQELTAQLRNHKVYGQYFPSIEVLENGTKESYSERLYSLAQLKQNYPNGLDGRHIAWITRRFLVSLGYAHSLNICHSAIYPEHMLISSGHAGILTGWIHAEKTNTTLTVVSSKRKSWYTTKKASPQLDIALLGKSLEEICSNEVEKPIRNFIKSFQFRSPSCWELEEEFQDILLKIYGKSKFVEINVENLV